MRIAVLILGLLLGLLMFFQSLVIASLGNGDIGAGGAIGVLVALCWLVCCALVLAFPLASAIGFVLAALFAMLAASSGFGDMWIWAIVSIALAVMSYFGWRGKRRDDRIKEDERRRQHQRDVMLQRMMQQSPSR